MITQAPSIKTVKNDPLVSQRSPGWGGGKTKEISMKNIGVEGPFKYKTNIKLDIKQVTLKQKLKKLRKYWWGVRWGV